MIITVVSSVFPQLHWESPKISSSKEADPNAVRGVTHYILVILLYLKDCLSFAYWLQSMTFPLLSFSIYTSAQDTIRRLLLQAYPGNVGLYRTCLVHTHHYLTLWYSLYAHHMNMIFSIPQWGYLVTVQNMSISFGHSRLCASLVPSNI